MPVSNPTNPATGAYTYTPNTGYSGADTFTFKANDGVADSNVATVDITVVRPSGVFAVADADKRVYRREVDQAGNSMGDWTLVAPGQFLSVVAGEFGPKLSAIYFVSVSRSASVIDPAILGVLCSPPQPRSAR